MTFLKPNYLTVVCFIYLKSPSYSLKSRPFSCVFATRWSSVGGILTKFVLDGAFYFLVMLNDLLNLT